MYEDILDDPEVQEMVEKYEGTHQNDVPLDNFGNPIVDDSQAGQPDEQDPEEGKETSQDTPDEDEEPEEGELNEDSLQDFIPEFPELDFTPQTEFSQSLDLNKFEDGFQKYVLTHIEPLVLQNAEGKTIRAYTAEDIPTDFEFKDQLELTKATTALARLETEGAELRKEYDEYLEEVERVNNEIELRQAQLDGLTDAIQNGEFPRLELDQNGNIDVNSKVNQLADDILSYQEEINEDRSPSRAISFDTALNRFQRDYPERFKDLEGSLSKEDSQRRQYASRTAHSAQRTGKNSSVGQYDNLSREEFDALLNDPEFDVSKLFK